MDLPPGNNTGRSMAYNKFKAPAGVIPEGIGEGDTFDVVTTFRVEKDGEICPIQVGDTKMPGYEDSEEKEPTTKQFKDEASDMVNTGKEMGIPEPQAGGY